MLKIKTQNLRFINTTNKGFWIMAKIYSDVKGNCSCGGSFSGKATLKGIEYPVCSSCKDTPTLFRIRAKVVDLNFQEKYIDIRHAQNGERLVDIFECFTTLRQIESELEAGKFDIRKYDSAQCKESYLFENYAQDYLKHHENRLARGEISPAGFKNKKKYVKVLAAFFSGKDIASIRNPQIEAFKDSFTDKFRTRDLALGELKAILNYAHKMEVIGTVPKFDLVPASKKRKEIISLDVANKVIEKIEDEQYKFMIWLLSIYPVRPCELRALKWSDVDYFGNEVSFRSHFSSEKLLDGRKSVSSGDKSEVNFPLHQRLRDYLVSIPRPLKKDEFIFKGKEQAFVSEKCLSNAWRKATRFLKLPDHQLYELRHARLSQIAEQSKGDIVTMLKVSGHTNPKTLMERYVRSNQDLSEFFQ
jgi:integrase